MIRRTVHRAASGLLLGGPALLAAGCGISLRRGAPSASDAAGPAVALAVDPGDGSLLAAGPAGAGVFRSADRGQSWQLLPVPAALHPDNVRRVATTTAAPASVYAGGPGAGVIRSDNRGQTWRTVSGSLPSQDVAALAVHSSRPDTLYAWLGGKDKGLYRTEDGGGRWQKMDFGSPAPTGFLVHSRLEGSMNTGWLYAATPEGPYLSMD